MIPSFPPWARLWFIVLNTEYAYLKQYADSHVHKWLGEIDNALSGVVDSHRGHGQVRFLKNRKRSSQLVFTRPYDATNVVWVAINDM